MDTAIGSDRTRLDLAVDLCYDGTQLTWFSNPLANRWAGLCYDVTGGSEGYWWNSYPWEAEAFASGFYNEECLADVGNHQLTNRIEFRGDGSATCKAYHSGSFLPGYDIDVECYYF